MPSIEKLTIPPLFTHSIDYDNNLTIYEAYGAMLHTLNITIETLNNVTQNILPKLDKRVTNNENNITLLLEYVDTLQQQMSTLLNTTIPAINDTLTAHNGRITTNETDIVKIKNDIITINNTLDDINSSLTDINTKLSSLEISYNSLNILTNNHTEQINTINTTIENIQNTLREYNTKITNNENSIASINTEMQEINQKIDNLNIDEINSLLQQIQTDIATANNIIEQFNNISLTNITLDNISPSAIIVNNEIRKNGKVCNLKLRIVNMGNIFKSNQYISIGYIENLSFTPITIGPPEVVYIGNCVIDNSGNFIPATLWAQFENGKIKLSILARYDSVNTGNDLYIDICYITLAK